MFILSIPKTKIGSYSDRARFVFTWRLSLFLCLALSVLSFSYYIIGRPNTIPFVAGAITGVLSLLLLYRTKSYKLSAILTALFGVVAVNFSIYFIVDGLHIGTLLWMAVICMFTYFTLGKKWGHLILVLNALGYSRYILFQLESNIENLPPFTTQLVVTLAMEISLCLLIIAYLSQLFINTNKYVEEQHENSISELNEQNTIISNQNKEMETMLKEIHHRVKNNLQVITSLLRLQSHALDADKAKEFNEAINRVKAMALIHEKMYQTKELSGLKLDNYFKTLANELIETYSVDIPIELIITSAVPKVGSKTIVPLALLFNELVSNSIEHAFQNLGEGKIVVSITECESGCLNLIYKDNGVWKEGGKETSFGLELIGTMTEQLEGRYEIKKLDSGTEFLFDLKNLEEDV